MTVDAGKDAVLDLTAFRRTDEALTNAITVVIDHINAGDDVDVVLNDSKAGNDPSSLVLVEVDLYNPGTPYYGYTFYEQYNPALRRLRPALAVRRGDCGSGSGQYETHFRPDGTDANLVHILRALGTDVDDEIDSTYNFTAVRAGDDIDICHVTRTAARSRRPATRRRSTAPRTSSRADTTPDTTSTSSSTRTSPGRAARRGAPVDDPGMAVNVSQIFIRTNGDITATELVGDMLVGTSTRRTAMSRCTRRSGSWMPTAGPRSTSRASTSR